MAASYTKLKSGQWGVRFVGSKPREGDQITVTKKDGTTTVETVVKVVYSGDNNVHLCVVERRAMYRRGGGGGRGRRKTGCSCGSYEDEVNDGDCFTCRHDNE